AMYQRQRSAWGFIGGGPGSGLHKSTDGGRTWTKLTGNGLPRGVMGRVGLAMAQSNPNVVYAQIEAQAVDGSNGNGVYRSDDLGNTWSFRSSENQRPMYYSHIEVDPTNADVVYVGGVN